MPTEPIRAASDENVKAILQWLALAHGRSGPDDTAGLLTQLRTLRSTALPTTQRLKLLDLLYNCAVQITLTQLPALHQATVPVSRRIRLAVRSIQELLESLAQDYLTTLAELFDPQGNGNSRPPHSTLRRVAHCLSWHLTIGFLVAAPAGAGIWQQLHATFRTARRPDLARDDAEDGERRLEQIYVATLLLAVAQPASFTSRELEFISAYIERCAKAVEILSDAPAGREGIFWIDPDKDAPAHALARRMPPPDTGILYFSCDLLAQGVDNHLAALDRGVPAGDLGLPELADTPGGRGVLKRLAALWGHPMKRKFSRRRQSYRADLCSGLDNLWQLLRHPDAPPPTSEWMVTNESPDGYAVMHVSGDAGDLHAGDIVSVRPHESGDGDDGPWHICIVRWALSENPEHIELGLQMLAPHGTPAEVALPSDPLTGSRQTALLLPQTPPLHPLPAIVLPSGTVTDPSQKLIVMVESGNLEIRELRATSVSEQTSSIEVFTVEPDERL